MDAFLFAANEIFQFHVLALLFFGVFGGIIIGAIPGLTPPMAIAIMTSFTFSMETIPAIMLLMGVYFGGIYGGSISSILLHIPGTPSAVMTAMDGYPMARRGEGGQAVGIAAWSSFVGGIIGMILLIIGAPLLTSVAIRFSAPEMFGLSLFGLSFVAGLSSNSLAKGILAAALGIVVCLVGLDPMTGVTRLTFGSPELTAGIAFVPALIGLFGLGEMLNQISKKPTEFIPQKLGNLFLSRKMMKRLLPTIVRSSLIGVAIGTLPGTGSPIASVIAYDQARRRSPNPEEYGTGIPEGVAAPESANNASCGGALMPMLTLGIPGDTITAILIGAFMLHSIQPGPLLFVEHPEIIYSIYIGGIIANFFMLCLGFAATFIFARLINFPNFVLFPVIMLLCMVGSFAVGNSFFDVYTTIAFGILSYFFTKLEIPLMPFVLGIVLGPILEENFRTMILMSRGSISYYFERPIALFIFTGIIVSIFYPIYKNYKANKS